MNTAIGKFWAVALGALMLLGVAATVSSNAAGAAPISGNRTYYTTCGTVVTYNSVTPGWKNIGWTYRPFSNSGMSLNGGSYNTASALGIYLGSNSSFVVRISCLKAGGWVSQSFAAY